MRTIIKCPVCKNYHHVSECYKVLDPITHYSYICPHCKDTMNGYSFEVDTFKTNISKKVPITTGIELELDGLTEEQELNCRILGKYGYTPSYDCTVQIEWKSPVYKNLNGMAKLLYSVIENNNIKIPSNCGTHINVWAEDLGSQDYKRIRRYYNTIFKDFYNAVRENNEDCEALFGRTVNGWCYLFDADAHKCLVNTEACKMAHPRLELRVGFYKNNKQFMNALRFANEWMAVIRTNFSKNFMTDADAVSRGLTSDDATAHNEHKAEITAKKLVKVYKKYVEKAYKIQQQ